MFWFTLFTIVLTSINASLLQNGLFSVASHFPARYTQAFMAGQGLAGLIVATSNFMITEWHPPGNVGGLLHSHFWPTMTENDVSLVDLCAFVYFVFGFVVLGGSVVAYGVFRKLPITKYYMTCNVDDASTEKLLPEAQIASTLGPRQVFSRLKWYAMSVFVVFFVTLAVFPALVSSIRSVHPSHSRLSRDLFIPLLFVLFNAGDLAGRLAAGRWIWSNPRVLFMLSSLRIAFVFLFLVCNIPSSSHIWFHHDFVPMGLVLLCSMTNGYFSSLAMMLSPTTLLESDQELGATVMFFMLSLGLTLGSSVSFLLN